MSKYQMTIDFNVLNHLGINLYSNIPAVLSEVVANSYDADATEVNIDIDNNDSVVITDNGCGMTVDDINEKYLHVGYQKRAGGITKTPIYKRKVMGRKGIGKLSLMSIANIIRVYSIKDNEQSALEIDVNKIKELIASGKKESYEPAEIEQDSNLTKGTKIVLKNIRSNRTLEHPDKVKTELARRFVVLNNEFVIKVNGEEITFADRKYFEKVKKAFIYGDCPIKFDPQISFFDSEVSTVIRENKLTINGKEKMISGWIGYVDKSDDLKDGSISLNKISLLTNGKLGQDDILQDLHNTSMFTNYIIGEINADFLDEEQDLATSNREEYQKDTDEYNALFDFLKKEVSYIGGVWNKEKEEQGIKAAVAVEPKIKAWFDGLEGDEKRTARKLLGKVNTMITNESQRKDFTKYSILAFEKMRVYKNLSDIENFNETTLASLPVIFKGINDIEESMYYQIVKQRMDIIDKFEGITNEQQKENVLQEYLYRNLWLLDPSWERPTSDEAKEKRLSHLFDKEVGLTKAEKNARIDIRFKNFAGKNVIVELKRYNRVVSSGEILNQIMKYSKAIDKILRQVDPGSSPLYEIIILLGKYVDNDSSTEHCEKVAQTLSVYNGRVVFYDELISNARDAYKAYFDAKDKLNPILDIFQDMDD